MLDAQGDVIEIIKLVERAADGFSATEPINEN